MIKSRIIENYYPPSTILNLFKNNHLKVDITNGYASVIEKTNIKQVFPIVYKFNDKTYYHFINEESTKKNIYDLIEHKALTENEFIDFLKN